MNCRVVMQRLARQDLAQAFEYAARQAPETAARWLDRFQAALQTLDRNPQRCPHAHENSRVDLELRELLFGRSPHVFRGDLHGR